MSDGPTREEEILARLAERDLTAVERVHDKLMAAEEGLSEAEAEIRVKDFVQSWQHSSEGKRWIVATKK